METATRWLLYFAVCLPGPIFALGLGPNAMDSGLLGLIVFTVILATVFLVTINLVLKIHSTSKRENNNAHE